MDTISQLECQVRDLIQEKQNREEQIKQHAISITELWDKLHISQEERDNWLTQNTTGDLGPQALAAVCNAFLCERVREKGELENSCFQY